jgi:hypothetical protein
LDAKLKPKAFNKTETTKPILSTKEKTQVIEEKKQVESNKPTLPAKKEKVVEDIKPTIKETPKEDTSENIKNVVSNYSNYDTFEKAMLKLTSNSVLEQN